MRKNLSAWIDTRMDLIIANLLRAGVVLAAVIILIGASIYLTRHVVEVTHYNVFKGQPADLRSVSGIVADTVSLRGRGIIQLGLLVLIATPVARVAFSVFAFALEHDFLYVAITLIVLAVLLFSLLGSFTA